MNINRRNLGNKEITHPNKERFKLTSKKLQKKERKAERKKREKEKFVTKKRKKNLTKTVNYVGFLDLRSL